MGLKDAFTKHLAWSRTKGTKGRKSSGEGLEMPLANTLEPATQPEVAPQPFPAVEAVPGREPTLEGPAHGEKGDAPAQAEERIQVKQLNLVTEAVDSASQAAPAVPPAPEQAPQQPAQPKAESSSGITDDLRQLFEEVQTGNEELKKLAQSLEDVDIRSLAKECSVVAARLKSRWGSR